MKQATKYPQNSISVAMTTYNGERYLCQQLDSLLSQLYPPAEIVVCDDGSVDSTLSILQEYATKFPSIVRIYKNKTRLGFVKNFEKSISLCQGDIIALSDQDDIWLPDKIGEIAKVCSASPGCGMVYSDALLVDANGESLGKTLYPRQSYSDPSINELIRRVSVKGCTLAFRSDLRPYLLPFPNNGWGHDHWITLIIAALTGIKRLNKPLMLYRRHPNNYGFDPSHKGIHSQLAWIRLNLSLWAYQEDQRRWGHMLNHLEQLHADETMPFSSTVESAIHLVKGRLQFAKNRLACRELNQLSRLIPILKMYYGGYYSQYGRGVRTLVQDIVALDC